MRITTMYKGKEVEVVNRDVSVSCQQHTVSMTTAYKPNCKTFIVEIEAGELLKTGKAICEKLSRISGIEFKMFHLAGSTWQKVG